MVFVDDWKLILKKAWSVKFNLIAAVFGGLEVAVQLIQPVGVKDGLFAGMAGMVSLIAILSRVLAQKEITNGPSSDASQ